MMSTGLRNTHNSDTSHGQFPWKFPDSLAAPQVVAVLTAVSIPSIVIGRSCTGAVLLLALLCVPFLRHSAVCWQNVRRALFTPLSVLIGITALLWLPSLINSAEPGHSFFTEIRTLFYLFGALVLWSVLQSHENLIAVCLKALLISSLILISIALSGVLGFIFDIQVLPEFVGFIRGHGWQYYNAKLFLKETASTGALLLPMLIFAGWLLRGIWLALSLITICEILALIYFTESRSAVAGLLGAAVICLGVMVLETRSRAIFAGSVLVVVAGAAVSGSLLMSIQADRAEYDGQENTVIPYWLIDAPRQGIWMKSLKLGEPYRWVGSGINAMDKLPDARKWNAESGTRNIPLHPHNWIVEVVVETGVIGFLSILTAITYGFIALIRAYVRTRHYAVLATLGVWGGYWVAGLFNFSFWSSWWLVTFFVGAAICLAATSQSVFRKQAGETVPEEEWRGRCATVEEL